MRNADFYAYCRDNRRSADIDEAKRQVLKSVYDYMRECGTTKQGVAFFIETRKREKPELAAAYDWLLQVFAGPSVNVVQSTWL